METEQRDRTFLQDVLRAYLRPARTRNEKSSTDWGSMWWIVVTFLGTTAAVHLNPHSYVIAQDAGQAASVAVPVQPEIHATDRENRVFYKERVRDKEEVSSDLRESDRIVISDAQPMGEAPDTMADQAATNEVSGSVITITDRTSVRYLMDPFVRSGCPQTVRRWAIPSTLANQYSGGYVGGGVPCLGESRYVDEGTWAIDYDGLLHKHVWLRWTHGRRYQGGTTGYQTDGPKLIRHH
jgi:hypothetical protein